MTRITAGVAVSLALMAAASVGYTQLHPLLRYVLDWAFLLCMVSVSVSVGVLALVYFRKIGNCNQSRAALSLSVVLLTIVSSSLFGLVTTKLQNITPTGTQTLDYAVALLVQLVSASNFILSFGTAGIALALLTGTFPKVQRSTPP